jgi:hypothetical protein
MLLLLEKSDGDLTEHDTLRLESSAYLQYMSCYRDSERASQFDL